MNSDKTKKIVFLSIGLILVVSFSAFLVNKNMHDPKLFSPVIKFTEERKDIGDIKQGPQFNGEFEFENTGKTPLEIKDVHASCGCTGILTDEKKIFQPGEKGKVKFEYMYDITQLTTSKKETIEI